MTRNVILFVILSFVIQTSLQGQIISQWRGPDRDGFYPNEKLLKEWPAAGPDMIWSSEQFKEGFSSPAVTDQRIFLSGMQEGQGYLYALDLKGKQIWVNNYGPEWNDGYPGSRSSVTVVGDKIYMVSGEGAVYCFRESDGKTLWKTDMVEKFGARNLRWGMTESPLIDGNRIFCTPGGRGVMMAVLDRNTGKTIKQIKGNGELSAYCSPCLVNVEGRRLVVTMTEKSLIALDADTYEFLWEYEHVTRYDINPNTPLISNGQIYAFSGYGTGGQLFKINKNAESVNRIWADETLDSQFGSAMLLDGHLYGSGHSNKGWHCVEWASGKVIYSDRVLGNKGNIIYSDGMFYCYSEKGHVGLVKPSNKKFEVVSSFKIKKGSGSHWAHPVISNGVLYIRHGEALMAFNISGN